VARCPSCRERLPDDAERRGARCPSCREPLYDEPAERRRSGEGTCAVHRDSAALGTCPRCGNYLCDVCRTRWRGRWLCAACVDRALENKEAVPGEVAAHLRQALLSLLLGIASWVLLVMGVVFAAAAVAGEMAGMVLLALLAIFAAPAASLFGVGLAVSALRSRGDHMILATLGLIISGLNVGALLGMMSFSLSLQY
jgi:hypothetical protein